MCPGPGQHVNRVVIRRAQIVGENEHILYTYDVKFT